MVVSGIITKLTRNGYEITKKSLSNQELKKIKKDLTVIPKVNEDYKKKDEEPAEYETFTENSKKITVPRFYGFERFGKPGTTTIDSGKKIKIKFNAKMRDYQVPIVDKTLTHLKKIGGAVISLPCGRGKTAIAINIITKLKLKTLVVVHQDFLLNQWKRAIKTFTNASVGIIKQNKIDYKDKDIVIILINSLCKRNYNIFDEFGFVITDECHHTSAQFFVKAFPKIVAKYSLGLSATPDRKDGTSKAFYWYIGKLIYKEKQQKNDKVQAYIYQYKSKNERFKMFFNYWGARSPNFSKTITEISVLEERNIFAANVINQIRNLPEKRKILVLSDRLKQLNILENMVSKQIAFDKEKYSTMTKLKKSSIQIININKSIKEKYIKMKDRIIIQSGKSGEKYTFIKNKIKQTNNNILFQENYIKKYLDPIINHFDEFGIHKHTTSYYIGKMKNDERDDAEKGDIIFATFTLAQEGLDIPDLNCVILASPKSKIEQPVGRILRQLVQYYPPLIIDIEDQIQIISGQGRKRRAHYSDCGYNIEFFEVNGTECKKIKSELNNKQFSPAPKIDISRLLLSGSKILED